MPNRLRLVVREISEGESPALVEYFAALEDIEDWAQWFDYVAKWTTNARWTDDATEVITSMLTEKNLVAFTENKKVFGEKMEAMIPYPERHFERLGIQAYAIDEIVDATELETKCLLGGVLFVTVYYQVVQRYCPWPYPPASKQRFMHCETPNTVSLQNTRAGHPALAQRAGSFKRSTSLHLEIFLC
jgi:hypothetical protein